MLPRSLPVEGMTPPLIRPFRTGSGKGLYELPLAKGAVTDAAEAVLTLISVILVEIGDARLARPPSSTQWTEVLRGEVPKVARGAEVRPVTASTAPKRHGSILQRRRCLWQWHWRCGVSHTTRRASYRSFERRPDPTPGAGTLRLQSVIRGRPRPVIYVIEWLSCRSCKRTPY